MLINSRRVQVLINEQEAIDPEEVKTTAERILDAAEDLFAEKGYSATSLGDVADRVGIRSPSLYNHFRNKEALYLAVMERLLDDFCEPIEQLSQGEVSTQRVMDRLEVIVRKHHANPNLARLLQHAALSGGPQSNELIDRFFQPMFQPVNRESVDIRVLGGNGDSLQPWAVMAFNNLVMSYVTMAPIYSDLLGVDPFSEEALEKQLQLIRKLLHAVFEYRGE